MISLCISLFLIMDALGAIPMVLSMLNGFDEKRKRFIVIRQSIFALGFLILFYIFGSSLLQLFSIQQIDLKVCGAIILGIISLNMLFPKGDENQTKIITKQPLLVPLAIPLIVGPSAIATVILLSATSENKLIGFSLMCLTWACSTVVLFLGVYFGKFLPEKLLKASERLIGLLLAAMATGMLLSGIHEYFIGNK